jgi:cyanophycinase
MPGMLMAMGGALDMRGPCVLLREFARLAGGADARIVVLATASDLPASARRYAEIFRRLGVRPAATVLSLTRRPEAQRPGPWPAIARATGIFFAGGNQVRLSAMLGGTPVEAALHAAHARGALLGGTSAGASILSATMVAFGQSGPTPRQAMAQFVPGLGFTRRVLFDQHFRQRDRLGRLLLAVANHPGVFGVGLDENTAVVLAGARLRVVGEGAVTIVDGHEMTATNVAEVEAPAPAALANARIHVLTHGCTFDLKRRAASIPIVRTASD